MIKKAIFLLSILLIVFFFYKGFKKVNFNSNYEVGQEIDRLNNVLVYYNGGVDHVANRNTKEGYNLGLEYQCVEFVKRYYYEYYNHKMPDSYGHAVSFYDENLPDGSINKQRNLIQYSNPSIVKPHEGDLIVMSGTLFNQYGHVAIVSKVTADGVEIIQQNPGAFSPSRETFKLSTTQAGKWRIDNSRIIGWLRK